MPDNTDPRLLVGSATADDAGVYQLNDSTALVQTLDFFTPISDDPFLFGQIAAANSLSDVYAMGGRPITAMAIAGMPDDVLGLEDIEQIFKGGAEMVRQAECSLVGGHTIKNPEPIYGLSVTGVVHPQKYLANAHAKEGDILILTKPIGTGIVATALKRGISNNTLNDLATKAMITLNTPGADLAEQDLVNGCTDITGFGLLGHLREMADGSNLTAVLNTSKIPSIAPEVLELINDGCVPGGTKKNLSNVADSVRFEDQVSESMQLLLADAQTSGGLLLSVSPENKNKVLDILDQHNVLCAEEIGEITARQDKAMICS